MFIQKIEEKKIYNVVKKISLSSETEKVLGMQIGFWK
jgi:hypothetical protein